MVKPTAMKKVILQLLFGEPHAWTKEYLKVVSRIGNGWHWKIFTPNKLPKHNNVEVIPMELEEFDSLIEKYCGVNPKNYMDGTAPHKLISDMYPAYGQILQDYTKGYDFWGHVNWDMVFGRIDRYCTDELLKKHDIWSDWDKGINGIFTVYRNNEKINNLFREIPSWEQMFTKHKLFYLDETYMSDCANKAANEGRIRFFKPPYHPFHSYDRLPQHVPTPKLQLLKDGTLLEEFRDTVTGNIFPKEIMSFHFSHTKQWPL